MSDATNSPEKHKISLLEVQTIIYKLLYAAGIRNHKDKKTRLGDKINVKLHTDSLENS